MAMLCVGACRSELPVRSCVNDDDCFVGLEICNRQHLCERVDADAARDSSDGPDEDGAVDLADGIDPTDVAGDTPVTDPPDDPANDQPLEVDEPDATPSDITPPVIFTDTVPTGRLPGSTRSIEFTVAFSEPVWGVDRESVTVSNGAVVTSISADDDRELFSVEVYGLWPTGEFTVTFGGGIRDGADNPMAPATRHFEVGGSAVYVDSAIDGTGLVPEYPAASLSVAILIAASQNRDAVLVAEGNYSRIELRDGVGVYGGFSSEFTQRSLDPQATGISSDGSNPVVTAAGPMGEGTVLDGFHISQLGGTAISITNGADIVLSRNVVHASNASSAGSGFNIGDSSPTLIDNEISAGTVTATGVAVGIAGEGSVRLLHNVITGGHCAASCTGVVAGAGAEVWIVGNRITGGSRATLMTGLYLSGVTGVVANNLIYGGTEGEDCRALSLESSQVHVVHNTIDAGSCTNSNIVVAQGGEAGTSLVNNLLFISAPAGGASREGIRENASDADPLAVRNNAFLPVEVVMVDDQTNRATVEALNAIEETVQRGQCGGSVCCGEAVYGGNLSIAVDPDAFFADFEGPDESAWELEDADWRPTGGEAGLVQQGLAPSLEVCGSTACPTVCATPPGDITGAPRSAPFTIGAYQLDGLGSN